MVIKLRVTGVRCVLSDILCKGQKSYVFRRFLALVNIDRYAKGD